MKKTILLLFLLIILIGSIGIAEAVSIYPSSIVYGLNFDITESTYEYHDAGSFPDRYNFAILTIHGTGVDSKDEPVTFDIHIKIIQDKIVEGTVGYSYGSIMKDSYENDFFGTIDGIATMDFLGDTSNVNIDLYATGHLYNPWSSYYEVPLYKELEGVLQIRSIIIINGEVLLDSFSIILGGNIIDYTEEQELKSRVSVLESWKESIEITINSIKAWLGFDNNANVCEAVDNCGSEPPATCSLDSQCPDTSSSNHCTGGDVYKTFYNGKCLNPGTQSAQCNSYPGAEVLVDDCTSTEVCESGECVEQAEEPTGEVLFRTDVVSGNYYGCTLQSNCWIAFDIDNDGDLDALGFEGKVNSCSGGTVLGHTPEGYTVARYSTSTTKLAICDGTHEERFNTAKSARNVELSKNPTEPYSTNNQEVYDSGTEEEV